MKLWSAALALTVLFGVVLRIVWFQPDIARTPDERTYTRQAGIVLEQGLSGFATLGDELARDPANVGTHPSPLRVGYLVPLTLFMKLTGEDSVQAGAVFSTLCSIASLILVSLPARRFFGPAAAVAAVLFLAVMPFDLVVARRAWEESYLSLLALLSMTLALWLARSRNRTGPSRYLAWGAFTILGLLSMTAKETSGLAFLTIALLLAGELFGRGDRRRAALAAFSAGLAALGYLAVLGSLFGGVTHALWLTRTAIHYSGTNPYNTQWDSGSRWMFVEGLWRVSPGIFLFALLAVALASYGLMNKQPSRAEQVEITASANRSVVGIAALVFIVLALQVLTARFSYRYAASVYSPICLLAGFGVAAVVGFAGNQPRPVARHIFATLLFVVVAVAAGRDLAFAQTKLLSTGMQDLALRMVLELGPLGAFPQPAQALLPANIGDRRVGLASAYIQQGRPALALPLLDAALAENASNAAAWNDRCVAHTLLHAYAEAAQDCRHALSLQPDFQLAKNNLAWTQSDATKSK